MGFFFFVEQHSAPKPASTSQETWDRKNDKKLNLRVCNHIIQVTQEQTIFFQSQRQHRNSSKSGINRCMHFSFSCGWMNSAAITVPSKAFQTLLRVHSSSKVVTHKHISSPTELQHIHIRMDCSRTSSHSKYIAVSVLLLVPRVFQSFFTPFLREPALK